MKYEIMIIITIIILLLIYNNIYKFKRIKRRMIIKKMKTDENINELIDEFKRNLKDNIELKSVQNKMRIVQIVKNIYNIFFWILILVPIPFFMYIPYIIESKNGAILIDEIYKIYKVYIVLLFTAIIAFFCIKKYINKNYLKNKNIIKEYIYNDFLRNLKYDIKWYEYNSIVSKDTYKLWNTYINWEEVYKKANFNNIQFDENIYQNTFLSKISPSKKIYFEDKIIGVYKEKYIISISDFREVMITGNIRRRYRHITHEGIFCAVRIDKNILNNIRITNDKKNVFFMEKQYTVTTMPKEFYKDFIILAEDGYKISEKISEKSIEMIENFYYNSKIKFDISIRDNEIFFKFKTIDSMELNSWRNVVDDVMLKEYANIIMFVTTISEEINNNWK